jgi:hypothetical protein
METVPANDMSLYIGETGKLDGYEGMVERWADTDRFVLAFDGKIYPIDVGDTVTFDRLSFRTGMRGAVVRVV